MADVEITDLAYFAGFVDGEGTIAIKPRLTTTTKYLLHVIIVNTNSAPLIKVKQLFGGKLTLRKRRNPRHKRCFRWEVQHKKAEIFLKAIQPYLLIKAEHCRMALLFRENFKPLSRGRSHNPDADAKELARRKIFSDFIAQLNIRGSKPNEFVNEDKTSVEC